MKIRTLTFALAMLFGSGASALAQQNAAQPPMASQQLAPIHGPESIDQELARLAKDLQLTPQQQNQVRPLLQEHHDKIQALFDKNPTLSRQQLAPQIHAISDETHREIHALLTPAQQEMEKAMVASRGKARKINRSR
ncbi:MAG: hypothetical protein WA629_12370 [Candidatus Aquilonibacter sp.]